uniref:Uncharacterized protein n=1 Tax=Mastacembelus armatus TaxID=205130 RepID=A0A7N8WL43_9TELE
MSPLKSYHTFPCTPFCLLVFFFLCMCLHAHVCCCSVCLFMCVCVCVCVCVYAQPGCFPFFPPCVCEQVSKPPFSVLPGDPNTLSETHKYTYSHTHKPQLILLNTPMLTHNEIPVAAVLEQPPSESVCYCVFTL